MNRVHHTNEAALAALHKAHDRKERDRQTDIHDEYVPRAYHRDSQEEEDEDEEHAHMPKRRREAHAHDQAWHNPQGRRQDQARGRRGRRGRGARGDRAARRDGY